MYSHEIPVSSLEEAEESKIKSYNYNITTGAWTSKTGVAGFCFYS